MEECGHESLVWIVMYIECFMQWERNTGMLMEVQNIICN